jgi:hypothetical protein
MFQYVDPNGKAIIGVLASIPEVAYVDGWELYEAGISGRFSVR